jgi:SAM-dependent methyltransferase
MTVESAVRVDPSNDAQLQAWDGDEGAYWALHADRFDRAVAAYHGPFMAAAGIQPGDRVLDVGCGTGSTTIDAAQAAHNGSALGVDLSSQMLAVARRRAADGGVTNADFLQADAQVHPFDAGHHDVAISRTGAMFFGDPVAAFANIAAALRPGGRLCLLVWKGIEANEWLREIAGALAAGRELPTPPPGAPGPFSLADPVRVRDVLGAAGFVDVDLAGAERPMWFGDTVEVAEEFIVGLLGWMLDGLDAAQKAAARAALRQTLLAHVGPAGVEFASATWTITARVPQ